MKEDSEQSLKDCWEADEVGRSELAKTSRFCYLVRQKKSMGEALNGNEEKILKAPPRQRKLSMPVNLDELPKINNNKDKDIPKGKISKNVEKNLKKDVDKPIVNQEYLLDLNKPNLPTLDLHTALNIRKFLSYCYDNRTIEKDNNVLNSIKI